MWEPLTAQGKVARQATVAADRDGGFWGGEDSKLGRRLTERLQIFYLYVR